MIHRIYFERDLTKIQFGLLILLYRYVIILAIMAFPIKELIEFEGNIYELTRAASKRAFQLAKIQSSPIYLDNEKVVSVAARQVFTHEVDYSEEK